MKVNEFFDYVVRVEQYSPSTSHVDTNHDSAQQMVTQVGKEIERISLLQPAHFYHHVAEEFPTEWNQLLQAYTKLKDASEQRIALQAEIKALLQARKESTPEYLTVLHRLYMLQTHLENFIAALFYSIGSHNSAMLCKPLFETGVNKMQSEQIKAQGVYCRQYDTALTILTEVLKGFYSEPDNHNYPLKSVIDWVKDQCITARIPFPKDEKSPIFKRIISSKIPEAVEKRKGAPQKAYRRLPPEKMAIFEPLFQ